MLLKTTTLKNDYLFFSSALEKTKESLRKRGAAWALTQVSYARAV